MSNYSFIHDKEQIDRFQKLVYNNFEQGQLHQVCIFARKKYGANVKNGSFTFHNLIVDKASTSDTLYRNIRKLEIPDDCYLDDIGNPFPSSCLAVYSTLAPRDGHLVIQKMYEMYFDKMKESLVNKIYPQIAFKKELRSAIGKSMLKEKERSLIQFDVDTKEKEAITRFIDWLKEKEIPVVAIVETHGGYHFIIDRKQVPNKSQGDLSQFKHAEISLVNSSYLIPVPGTFQGGFPVRFVDDMM